MKILVLRAFLSLTLSGLAFASLSQEVNPQARNTAQAVKIRVRVGERLAQVSIHGFDLQMLTTAGKWESPDRATRWEFHCTGGRISARQNNSQNRSQNTSKAPYSKTLFFGKSISIESPAGFVTFNGRPYREQLRIYSIDNHCEIVNHLELEKYLEGLVNSEFSSKWKEEAIAAQVVAARTYGYYQILTARQNPDSRFDLDASVKDQVYDGSFREDFHASRIVTRTRGEVLTAGLSPVPVPIKAFYHSTCGGVTETPENVWGTPFLGFKRPVVCPFCAGSPKFHWEFNLRTSELEGLLRKGIGPRALSSSPSYLVDLRTQGTDPSGRVLQVISVWKRFPPLSARAAPIEVPVSAVDLRKWLGTEHLKSTHFNLSLHRVGSEIQWHFEGLGNGHGVGMCQWGAKVMAEKNYQMAAILKHYYPDAVLRRLW